MPSLLNLHPDVSASAPIPSDDASSHQKGILRPPLDGGVGGLLCSGTGSGEDASPASGHDRRDPAKAPPLGVEGRQGEGYSGSDAVMREEFLLSAEEEGFLAGCQGQRAPGEQLVLLRLGGWGGSQPLCLPPAKELVECLVELPKVSGGRALLCRSLPLKLVTSLHGFLVSFRFLCVSTPGFPPGATASTRADRGRFFNRTEGSTAHLLAVVTAERTFCPSECCGGKEMGRKAFLTAQCLLGRFLWNTHY